MGSKRFVFTVALLGIFVGAALLPMPASAENYPVKGEVLTVRPVQDKLGSGVIVYSRFEKNDDKNNTSTMTIHAYRFNREGGRLVRVWQINDGIIDCELDGRHAAFRGEGDGAPVITDLDGDGLKEIWTGYACSCKGDPSPDAFKIIMYEGKTKYAMRGDTLEKMPDGTKLGGKGTMDDAFRSGPGVFRAYVQKLWNSWRNGFGM